MLSEDHALLDLPRMADTTVCWWKHLECVHAVQAAAAYNCAACLSCCPTGQIAFVSGAAAAVGSGVVKVPIAVCIRSVQAGVYPDVFAAARSITKAAGPRGLFTVSQQPSKHRCAQLAPTMSCVAGRYDARRGIMPLQLACKSACTPFILTGDKLVAARLCQQTWATVTSNAQSFMRLWPYGSSCQAVTWFVQPPMVTCAGLRPHTYGGCS
jgi:hypothetical protein